MNALLPLGPIEQIDAEDFLAQQLAAVSVAAPEALRPDPANIASLLSTNYPRLTPSSDKLHAFVCAARLALGARAQEVLADRLRDRFIDRLMSQAAVLRSNGERRNYRVLEDAATSIWSDAELVGLDTLHAESEALFQSLMLALQKVLELYPNASHGFKDAVAAGLQRRRQYAERVMYHSLDLPTSFDRRRVFEAAVHRWVERYSLDDVDVERWVDGLDRAVRAQLRSRLRARAEQNGRPEHAQSAFEQHAARQRQRARTQQAMQGVAGLTSTVASLLRLGLRHSVA